MANRFSFIDRITTAPIKMCEAVKEGLEGQPRSIPTRFLYDRAGSELFEKITELPEYYLTRTEQSILKQYGPEIAGCAGQDVMLIEFGSGSSLKTRLIIESILSTQGRLKYAPIDISHDFLCQSADALLEEYSELQIEAVGAEYFDAIHYLPEHDGPRLILFLGSNIGNFTREQSIEFLQGLQEQLTPADRLLIGIDLAKPRQIVEPAYNDAQGVTAEFNLNLLARINRELDANFDLSAFEHRAPYDEKASRIEMQLISQADQEVYIDGIGGTYRFSKGEVVHTEWSHKYSLTGFADLARQAKLQMDCHWTDENRWFGTVMLRA